MPPFLEGNIYCIVFPLPIGEKLKKQKTVKILSVGWKDPL